MYNRVFCPITSYQKQYQSGTECMEEACAFWDEEREQCCIKTMALAVAAKPSGGFNPPASDFAVFPPPNYNKRHWRLYKPSPIYNYL